jgi:hypothetical protein
MPPLAAVGVQQSSAGHAASLPRLQVNAVPAPTLQRLRKPPKLQDSAPAKRKSKQSTTPTDKPRSDSSSGKGVCPDLEVGPLKVPDFKVAAYEGTSLVRPCGYARSKTNQRAKWLRHVAANSTTIVAKLEAKLPTPAPAKPKFRYRNEVYEGSLQKIAKDLAIPKWGPKGGPVAQFHVDHIKELQLGGEDEVHNMQLLESGVNSSAGINIRNSIDDTIKTFTTARKGKHGNDVEALKKNYNIMFTRADGGLKSRPPKGDDIWEKKQITDGDQVDALEYVPPGTNGPPSKPTTASPSKPTATPPSKPTATPPGKPTTAPPSKPIDQPAAKDKTKPASTGTVKIHGNASAGRPKHFDWPGPINTSTNEHTWLRPLQIVGKKFDTKNASSANLGHLSVTMPKDDPALAGGTKNIPVTRKPGELESGFIDKKGLLDGVRAKSLSPIRIDTADIDEAGGISATGVILPDAPLLQGKEIPFKLAGGQLSATHELGAGDIKIPAPFQVRKAAVSILAGSGAGFSAQGGVDFGIDGVGEGRVTATIGAQGLALDGGFDFDSKLFEPARVGVSYKNKQLTGTAKLKIPEKKVPGIESATIDVAVGGGKISGKGTIKPALPGFQQGSVDLSYSATDGLMLGASVAFNLAPLDPTKVRLDYRKGAVSARFDTGISANRIPGIEKAKLAVLVDNQTISGEGTLKPAFPGVQQAQVKIGYDPAKGLNLGGKFAFDSGLFEQSEVELGYQEGKLHGSGNFKIASSRVPGVDTASLRVAFDGAQASGDGELDPTLPGLKPAKVSFSYAKAKGYRIGGTLGVEGIPHVQAGEITAEVSAPAGSKQYDLAAKGTLTVGVAGFNVAAQVDYRKGMFTVSGKAPYNVGKAKGEIEVGVTNRAVDKNGKLLDRPGAEIRPFGRGSVTLALTKWLTGAVGVKLMPNGELEFDGALTLPTQVKLFERKGFEKKFPQLKAIIPIFGPLSAMISGGISIDAGVGPGTLENARLAVKYNPSRPDQTQVNGGVSLVIPGTAGLTLVVRGSIGAGIPVLARADLGLEGSARLGIHGALKQDLQLAWRPGKGLAIDTTAAIEGQPRLRFTLSGFASVTALGFEWEKKWELAKYEFGSGLRFAMKVPIHYDSENGLRISWDAVQFEKPDLEPGSLIKGLLNNTGKESKK